MAGFYVSAHKMYCPNGRAKETIETKSTTTTKERGGGEGRQTDRQTDTERGKETDRQTETRTDRQTDRDIKRVR